MFHEHCLLCEAHASSEGYALAQEATQDPVLFTKEQRGLASHCELVWMVVQACWQVPVEADHAQLLSAAHPDWVGNCSVQDCVHDEPPLNWQVESVAHCTAVLYVEQASLQDLVATFHEQAAMAMQRPWLSALEQSPSQVFVTAFHWQRELSASQPD